MPSHKYQARTNITELLPSTPLVKQRLGIALDSFTVHNPMHCKLTPSSRDSARREIAKKTKDFLEQGNTIRRELNIKPHERRELGRLSRSPLANHHER